MHQVNPQHHSPRERASLPFSQWLPVNPEGQTHLLGAMHVPPYLQPSSQNAVTHTHTHTHAKQKTKNKRFLLDKTAIRKFTVNSRGIETILCYTGNTYHW